MTLFKLGNKIKKDSVRPTGDAHKHVLNYSKKQKKG